jgi:hypothetical protein
MSKLLITIALLLAAFCAPAKAQEFTPESFANVAVQGFVYDQKCGGLPSNAKIAFGIMIESADRNQLAPQMMNVNLAIGKVGLTAWCNSLRPLINQMNAELGK